MVFLGLWLAAVISGPAVAENRVALVIGNAGYNDQVGTLRSPRKDADLIAASLRARGFDVQVEYDAGRVMLLRSVQAYARKLAAAGPDAIGFFYYSGHGIANPDTRLNYIVPVDVTTAADDRLWYESVPLEELMRMVTTAARGAVNIVVFDACRDELNLPKGAKGLGSADKGLQRVPPQSSALIAFSTSPDSIAADTDPNAPTGPYASELAAQLAVPGLDVKTIFDNVKFAVFERTGQKQLPWVEDGLAKRVFLSMPQPTAVASPVVADPAQIEVLVWQGALAANSLAAFRDYLRRYPHGTFALQAQGVIERIQSPPAAPSALVPKPAPSTDRMTGVQQIEMPHTGNAAEDEYGYGYRLWEAKFYPEAEQHLLGYIKTYATGERISFARNLLGRVYLDSGRPRDAAQWFLNNYRADKNGARAADSVLNLAEAMRQLNDAYRTCVALSEFKTMYAAEVAGRLKAQYEVIAAAARCK